MRRCEQLALALFGAGLAMSIVGLVWAQEPPKKPSDPIIEEVGKSLSPEGIQERQLRAIKALADAFESKKAELIAEREWWAGYLKGLETQ